MNRLAQQWRAQRQSIGFVPTMGALHAGHRALMQRARRDTQRVVVSLFVNPLQFGPREDFAHYPRPRRADTAQARSAGVDVLFAPSRRAMYPAGHISYVEVARLTDGLCGRFRPGHFRGVATIVTALLNIVQPQHLYVGQKDAQQARVIQQLARDLHLRVKVHVLPTVREQDGLAVSSRNAYLTPRQRQVIAPRLYGVLQQCRQRIHHGARDPRQVRRRAMADLRRVRGLRVEYVELVRLRDLRPMRRLRGRVLMAAAVWVGRTRLIDNLVVDV